jgi:hypothetical protein
VSDHKIRPLLQQQANRGRKLTPRLLVDFPGDLAMRVSPETIYTSLFVQTKEVLRGELTGQLSLDPPMDWPVTAR